MVKIPNGNLGKVHILLSSYNVKYLSVDNVTTVKLDSSTRNYLSDD